MSSLIAIFLLVVTQAIISIGFVRLEINNWNKLFYICVVVFSYTIQHRLVEFLTTP